MYQSVWTTVPLALGTFAARHLLWAGKLGITLNASGFTDAVADFRENRQWFLL